MDCRVVLDCAPLNTLILGTPQSDVDCEISLGILPIAWET